MERELIRREDGAFRYAWVVDLGYGAHPVTALESAERLRRVNPAMFQPVLPKLFIHRMAPGELLFAFFDAWKAAWRETMAMKAFGPRQWFSAAAKKLAAQGVPVDIYSKLLSLGLLRLNSSAGVEPVVLDR